MFVMDLIQSSWSRSFAPLATCIRCWASSMTTALTPRRGVIELRDAPFAFAARLRFPGLLDVDIHQAPLFVVRLTQLREGCPVVGRPIEGHAIRGHRFEHEQRMRGWRDT